MNFVIKGQNCMIAIFDELKDSHYKAILKTLGAKLSQAKLRKNKFEISQIENQINVTIKLYYMDRI